MKRTITAALALPLLLGALACNEEEGPGPQKDLYWWPSIDAGQDAYFPYRDLYFPREGSAPNELGVYPDLNLLCSSANCLGCCAVTSAGGAMCYPGNTEAACGTGGTTCQQCSSGSEKCVSGVCKLNTCDSTSCPTGCCDSTGTCVSGTLDTACGKGGGTCQNCSSTSLSCVGQTCTTSASKVYQVILVSATKVSSFKCNYNEWPFSDTCDFYVELTVDKAMATSKVIDNNDNPTWNELLLNSTEAQITKYFYAEVWDDDWPWDENAGECKTTITSADLTAGTKSVECGEYSSAGFTKKVTLTFQFK